MWLRVGSERVGRVTVRADAASAAGAEAGSDAKAADAFGIATRSGEGASCPAGGRSGSRSGSGLGGVAEAGELPTLTLLKKQDCFQSFDALASPEM